MKKLYHKEIVNYGDPTKPKFYKYFLEPIRTIGRNVRKYSAIGALSVALLNSGCGTIIGSIYVRKHSAEVERWHSGTQYKLDKTGERYITYPLTCGIVADMSAGGAGILAASVASSVRKDVDESLFIGLVGAAAGEILVGSIVCSAMNPIPKAYSPPPREEFIGTVGVPPIPIYK